jgi:hypothetical protein
MKPALRGVGLVAASLAVCLAAGAVAIPAKLYELTIETGMPHLEENLRYTTVRERRCLAAQDLPAAFPLLQTSALAGCRLDEEDRSSDTVSYLLQCQGSNASSGRATWLLSDHRLRGSLSVKLGGKNMTVYQHVTATHVGACPSSS